VSTTPLARNTFSIRLFSAYGCAYDALASSIHRDDFFGGEVDERNVSMQEYQPRRWLPNNPNRKRLYVLCCANHKCVATYWKCTQVYLLRAQHVGAV